MRKEKRERPGIFCLLRSSDQFTIWSCCSSKNGLFTSFLGWGLRPYSDHARPSWTCRKKHSKGPWQATACFGGAGWLTWPHYFRHKWAQTSTVDFLTTNLFLAVQRMAWSPLFWAGGCGRIRIMLVCPEEIRQMELTWRKIKDKSSNSAIDAPPGVPWHVTASFGGSSGTV